MGDMLVLEARDNGVGLPPGLDWRTARSLGLRLVNRLAEQIHGELEVEGGAGTCFRLTFPVGEMDD
jgi:two-component sensor histidine kinase